MSTTPPSAAGKPTTRDKMTGALLWTFIPRGVQVVFAIFTNILIVRTFTEYEYGWLKTLQGKAFSVMIRFSSTRRYKKPLAK